MVERIVFQRKKNRWGCLLFFFAGVFLINVAGSDWFVSYGLFPFWKQLSYQLTDISNDRYFCYLIFQRFRFVFLLVLLMKVTSQKFVLKTGAFLFCFLVGMFFAMAVIDCGLYGIVIIGCAMFPHWLCYIGAYVWYDENLSTKKRSVRILPVLVWLLLGCLSEAYVAPLLFQQMF